MISVRNRRPWRKIQTVPVRMSLLVGLLVAGCIRPEDVALSIEGATMGTTYHIRYEPAAAAREDLKRQIDRLLEEVNLSVSTYVDTSLISRINSSADTARWHPVDGHFQAVFDRAEAIYLDTAGAFNPALGPLVDAWGFGPAGRPGVPDAESIRTLLGLSDPGVFVIEDDPPALRKQRAGAQLDFSAIAKGYAVDAVSALLEAEGVSNSLVEIGGEVRSRGAHPAGRPWRVGIETPSDVAGESEAIRAVIELGDASMATSGNYRNYYVEAGRRYAHILDPETGYPTESALLSVSVLAPDAMTADAYATAFMVMGVDESLDFVEVRPGLEAYFISSGPGGGYVEARSAGFPLLVDD